MTSLKKIRFLNVLKNFKMWGMIGLYFIVPFIFDSRPDEMILYLLPECLGMMLMGVIYEMTISKSFSKAIGRFFVYVILIGLTLFLLSFPLGFTILLNSSSLPELDLFYSESAEQILIYLDSHDSWISLFKMPFVVFGWSAVAILFASMINILFIRIEKGSIFTGEQRVPYELKYVSFMVLGFLIGSVPAFIIGKIIPGSFPLILIIVMKLYTQYMMTDKYDSKTSKGEKLSTIKPKKH